ncbi:nuclease-related domain-containing protein [Fundicoccus culcitae]|uniref:NERD domain-containing protein n=1 Tax=Fundicoccus culcitae TaxID=2969821 RepID=A0ABY5P849_9LACT|nr:nuclease-related domain-containing protein [Fundicoccus culcitae]UUX34765.1 NERD domain-containing protein [Fundicoccus culcitae]
MEKNIELVFLEYKEKRGVLTETNRLNNLQRGYEGEREFVKWYNDYVNSDWLFIEDYWFDYEGVMQTDFILISPKQWLVIDVKNYDCLFEYRNGKCYYNQKPSKKNIFNTMIDRTDCIRSIAESIYYNVKVDPVMVFINPHGKFIYDQLPALQIVTHNDLRDFIKYLPNHTPLQNWQTTKIQNTLNKYRTDYNAKFSRLQPQDFSRLNKGIYCNHCGKFEVERGRYSVKCKHCHTSESLEATICRHGHELNSLFHDNPEFLTTQNVFELMGQEISKRTIKRHLGTNFTLIPKSQLSYYVINS